MPAEAPPRLAYLEGGAGCSPGSRQQSRAGLTDIDRRMFCPLTYAQALLDHGFGHKDAGDGMTTTLVDTVLRRAGGTDAARLGPE